MKTIKDAVIELGGKWPEEKEGDTLAYGHKVDCFWAQYHEELDLSCETEICTRQEFEAEAKRLGYINGYRWGVEYPTNGKRPDLPDDLLISVAGSMINGNWYMHEFTKLAVDWRDDVKFKVVDQRHKPADTSYLDIKPQDHIVEADETVSDWWDYENNKAIKLPPAGIECERRFSNEWIETSIVSHHCDGVRAIFCDEGFSIGELGYMSSAGFRPLDHATRKAKTEREKVIDAANKLLIDEHGAMWGLHKEFCVSLYNAGMLVLPPKKSDTKD